MATQDASTAAAGTVTLRRGRLKVVLAALVAVFVASTGLLVVVLVSGGFSGIDRSDPRVVIGEFLQAVLVDHDAARAQSFMCSQWQAAEAERTLTYSTDPDLVTTWGVIGVTTTDDSADAGVEIRSRLDGVHVAYWRIGLTRASDGWRACSAVLDPSLAPK